MTISTLAPNSAASAASAAASAAAASDAANTTSLLSDDTSATDTSAAATIAASQPLTVAGAKAQLNASIVVSALDVTLTSQNSPLALLYKTAVENLNDVLRPTLGDNAIQNASTEDNTPEATAGRIVGFISNAYELYRQQHADETPSVSIEKFMAMVKPGVEAGFKEGRDILSGLNVLNGDIASNVDKTYDLVQQGLTAFIAAKSVVDSGTATAAADGTTSAATTDGSAAAAAAGTSASTAASATAKSTGTAAG